MPIMNYTTKIPASRTIAEIQRILARYGASAITTRYEEGKPSGLTFTITTEWAGTHTYILPANIEGVWQRLIDDLGEHHRGASMEQAARVAFRILKDWVQVQMALIEADMAEIDEIFLPYLQTPAGTSLYVAFVERGGNLLLNP
ncbi:MAG: uncharacterized protein JWO59_689 [Chloroflexi bacterium]|nr:uncharacterized protein [Chloroflexota bacterium]